MAFQAKTQATKFSIEIPPCTWRRRPGRSPTWRKPSVPKTARGAEIVFRVVILQGGPAGFALEIFLSIMYAVL